MSDYSRWLIVGQKFYRRHRVTGARIPYRISELDDTKITMEGRSGIEFSYFRNEILHHIESGKLVPVLDPLGELLKVLDDEA